MSETVVPLKQSVVTRTVTTSSSYQQLFTNVVENSLLTISMDDNGTNIGSVTILISGGVAKNICFSGMDGYSSSTDLGLLPLAYGAYVNSVSYTLWFDYSGNTIYIANDIADDNQTITYTGLFITSSDNVATSIYACDKLVENTTNAGIVFDNKVIINNGTVNIGTSGSTTHEINIATNSNTGGRTLNLGNTVSGSTTVLHGVIETPNPVAGTVVFNDTTDINWTDVSSTVQRIGKVCHAVIKANLNANNAITAGTIHNFFSLTPTVNYTTLYTQVGVAVDINSNVTTAVIGTVNSADFSLIIPTSVTSSGSTTIIASVTFIR